MRARLRQVGRWALRAVLAAAAGIVAVWIGLAADWTGSITLAGVAVMVAPLYGYWLWQAHHRGVLIDRVDEALDGADQALRDVDQLREQFREHRHPIAAQRPPEDPRAPRAVTDTQTFPAQPRTAPRPAVDIAGGARVTSQPAEHPPRRGRHAAPDTGVHDALRQQGAS